MNFCLLRLKQANQISLQLGKLAGNDATPPIGSFLLWSQLLQNKLKTNKMGGFQDKSIDFRPEISLINLIVVNQLNI